MKRRDLKEERAAAESPAGKRVTVVGLGRFGGGLGVTKWLVAQGARVTVSDKANARDLAESLAQLEGLDVELHLGGHADEDFLNADLLVVSPAVDPNMPLLQKAAQAGIPRTSEINLFMERCPAPMVGITGSVGKSTTSAMTAAILSTKFTTHLGGNIGKSLLETLDQIEATHIVVLELSSFQLEQLSLIALSPYVAVVTNVAPNHLDRHGTMDAYCQAKKNIFRFQRHSDVLVLNANDPIVASWAAEAPGRVEFFQGSLLIDGEAAAPELSTDPPKRFNLPTPGEHNQTNAQAAWTAAKQFGVTWEEAQKALMQYSSLPHRLQYVANRDGVKYYNDSKCTTPGGAIVALRSFEAGKTIIIAGGYDKGVEFDELGSEIAARAKAVVLLGATADKIAMSIEPHRVEGRPVVMRASDLGDAVRLARQIAQEGDVVLLSPACASYDMFINYEQRGELFVKLVTGA
ncbi:MAG: UDP-N-acetylmuramoyl-L-alanine--D-glutamate ligase [Planctomycetes bacterium]|jgi:UDP-N-acetylmuramoylalanine--D-glutamate ligase|nr:UDP-N-acetylmuramoyl-L-alanine--D-glutamate ligase [Planctomycetota bacterium]